MALLDAGPRSASARVACDCSLIPITEDQIQHRITQLDPILRMCLGVVLARYRDMLRPAEQCRPRAATCRAPDRLDEDAAEMTDRAAQRPGCRRRSGSS